MAELPPPLKNMLAQARGKEKRTVVNAFVQRDENGGWPFNEDDPIVKHRVHIIEWKYEDDFTMCKPVVTTRVAFGGHEGFQDAIETGDAEYVSKNGRNFAKWNEIQAGACTGSNDKVWRRVINTGHGGAIDAVSREGAGFRIRLQAFGTRGSEMGRFAGRTQGGDSKYQRDRNGLEKCRKAGGPVGRQIAKH